MAAAASAALTTALKRLIAAAHRSRRHQHAPPTPLRAMISSMRLSGVSRGRPAAPSCSENARATSRTPRPAAPARHEQRQRQVGFPAPNIGAPGTGRRAPCPPSFQKLPDTAPPRGAAAARATRRQEKSDQRFELPARWREGLRISAAPLKWCLSLRGVQPQGDTASQSRPAPTSLAEDTTFRLLLYLDSSSEGTTFLPQAVLSSTCCPTLWP